MAINFPNSPALNDTYTVGETVWKWNGTSWSVLTSGNTFNGGTITNTLNVSNVTASTSSTTGGLTVTGGVGIGGNVNVAGSFSGRIKGYSLQTNALGNITGNVTVDLNLGNFVTATATGNVTWTFSNPPSSPNTGGFVMELTNGGSVVHIWPAATKWPMGVAPTLTVTGVDLLTFITDDGGSNWRGVMSMSDSR